jgi:hypothetical protein
MNRCSRLYYLVVGPYIGLLSIRELRRSQTTRAARNNKKHSAARARGPKHIFTNTREIRSCGEMEEEELDRRQSRRRAKTKTGVTRPSVWRDRVATPIVPCCYIPLLVRREFRVFFLQKTFCERRIACCSKFLLESFELAIRCYEQRNSSFVMELVVSTLRHSDGKHDNSPNENTMFSKNTVPVELSCVLKIYVDRFPLSGVLKVLHCSAGSIFCSHPKLLVSATRACSFCCLVVRLSSSGSGRARLEK